MLLDAVFAPLVVTGIPTPASIAVIPAPGAASGIVMVAAVFVPGASHGMLKPVDA